MSNYKSFISILGTNNYLDCRHSFNDLITDKPVKYCQEDIIKFFCKNYDNNFEIRIFLTEEAERKNWFNDGHIKNNLVIENIGLKERLDKLVNPSIIKPIRIKEGYSEKEIWDNFQIIYDTFREDEEVIVDITHSFRSLPLLMITLLNFAKQIKRIKVSGIYYAAFETLGPIPEVEKIPPEKRVAPVLDLTSFANLQDWTNATYDFINHANANSLKNISRDIQLRIGRNINSKNALATLVELNDLIDNIVLCRGNWILEKDFEPIKKNILLIKENNQDFKPLNALVDKLYEKIKSFIGNGLNNVIEAINLCYKHNYYQQSITLLLETIITLILTKLNYPSDKREYRQVVSNAFHIKKTNKNENDWNDLCKKNKQLTLRVLDLTFTNEILDDFEYVSEIRHDINHGGFLFDSKNNDAIKSRLRNSINNIIPKLKQFIES